MGNEKAVFEISVIGPFVCIEDCHPHAPTPGIKGGIRIASFRESFVSPVDAWTRHEYESQRDEARRRLDSGADRSCVAVSVCPPELDLAIEIWAVWQREREYRVQNLYLSPDAEGIGDPSYPCAALADYTNRSVGGERIQERSVPLDTEWQQVMCL